MLGVRLEEWDHQEAEAKRCRWRSLVTEVHHLTPDAWQAGCTGDMW